MMTYEERCRKQALVLLKRMTIARHWLSCHKPSLGFYGEYILIQVLKGLLPDCCGVCQGFVLSDEGSQSNQCDIIIYRKGCSIIRSFGSTKFVHSDSVLAVVEVKSSIQEKTFHSTMGSFEKLRTLGVNNTYLFVYNSLSKRNISNWLVSYKSKDSNTANVVTDEYLCDWSDMEWLPNAMLSLRSMSLYSLEYAPFDEGDWMAYSSYSFFDKENLQVSCLQEFLLCILRIVDENTPEIDFQRLTLEKVIPLFR